MTASCYYTTALSGRNTLYDTNYAKWEQVLSTEYVVLSADDKCTAYEQGEEGSGNRNLRALLQENGYVPVAEISDTLTVFHREEYQIARLQKQPGVCASVKQERYHGIYPEWRRHRKCR